ncbi:MAG: hypothetical protein LBV47_04470, partial [Bacteroidales bacterium]|nr:hypothetical protein [Bacteroidales bacterium]
TDYEYAEFSHFFNFHKANINKEFKKMQIDFECAYQYKHRLYCDKKTDAGNVREVTAEDILRMEKYASEMQDVKFYKAIAK